MKKGIGLSIVSVCVVMLVMFALPAFAAPFDKAAHNNDEVQGACLQECIGVNDCNSCDRAKAGLGQRVCRGFVDENENGVCDHYETGECACCVSCDGTGNGQCFGNGLGGHYGHNSEYSNCYGR